MSIVDLDTVKNDLRITHDSDDAILRVYLDASEDEALQFLDRDSFGGLCPCEEASSEEPVSSEDSMPKSVALAVLFLVRSKYEVADPAVIQAYRQAAETLLMPYRCGYGV